MTVASMLQQQHGSDIYAMAAAMAATRYTMAAARILQQHLCYGSSYYATSSVVMEAVIMFC